MEPLASLGPAPGNSFCISVEPFTILGYMATICEPTTCERIYDIASELFRLRRVGL